MIHHTEGPSPSSLHKVLRHCDGMKCSPISYSPDSFAKLCMLTPVTSSFAWSINRYSSPPNILHKRKWEPSYFGSPVAIAPSFSQSLTKTVTRDGQGNSVSYYNLVPTLLQEILDPTRKNKSPQSGRTSPSFNKSIIPKSAIFGPNISEFPRSSHHYSRSTNGRWTATRTITQPKYNIIV